MKHRAYSTIRIHILRMALVPMIALAHPPEMTQLVSVSSQETPSGPDFRISAGTSSGGSAFGFGLSIGLDFRSGVLRAAWADNSNSAEGDLDLVAAAVAVASAGGVSVGRRSTSAMRPRAIPAPR
jgi:hypothetical protein